MWRRVRFGGLQHHLEQHHPQHAAAAAGPTAAIALFFLESRMDVKPRNNMFSGVVPSFSSMVFRCGEGCVLEACSTTLSSTTRSMQPAAAAAAAAAAATFLQQPAAGAARAASSRVKPAVTKQVAGSQSSAARTQHPGASLVFRAVSDDTLGSFGSLFPGSSVLQCHGVFPSGTYVFAAASGRSSQSSQQQSSQQSRSR